MGSTTEQRFTIKGLIAEIGDDPDHKPKRRVRKPSLAGIKKQADKAGVEIARYEFRPDGGIDAVVGKPEAELSEFDKWKAKRNARSA